MDFFPKSSSGVFLLPLLSNAQKLDQQYSHTQKKKFVRTKGALKKEGKKKRRT
jgi:hypothetical protein